MDQELSIYPLINFKPTAYLCTFLFSTKAKEHSVEQKLNLLLCDAFYLIKNFVNYLITFEKVKKIRVCRKSFTIFHATLNFDQNNWQLEIGVSISL